MTPVIKLTLVVQTLSYENTVRMTVDADAW